MRRRSFAPRRLAAVVAAMVCTGLVSVQAAHGSVASDQAQIVVIQRRIAAQGELVRSLVVRENTTQSQVDSFKRQIVADEQRVGTDQRHEAAARLALRQLAVGAYMTDGGINSPAFDLFSDSQSITSSFELYTYAGSVGDQISKALAALQAARETTERDVNNLHAAKDAASHALDQLRTENGAVTSAIATEQRTLTSVKQDLRKRLQAARATAQLATELALAKYPWPTKDGPLPPIPPPTPGSYANPVRAIRQLTAERIDMGVDYSGYGPIYAIGDGIVLTTTVPGWPGGTMIVYQLTDGPANGLVVYAAEDIAPAVQVGDTVTATTVLGLMYLGPDGIETGWGDPAIIGNTLAGDIHEFNGANTTACGANFSEFLHGLGAPPGVAQNQPPTGTLPRNWPQWQTTTPATHP
jgi:murein DD-endopeptidase MepM/ murein hydrolase activator NlpD